MKKVSLIILSLCLILCGCSVQTPITGQTTEAISVTIPALTDMFTDRDLRTEPENGVYTITLSNESIVSDCASVAVSGSTVTITEEADYHISGALSDGMIIVDTDKEAKIHLILSNTSIHSEGSAAIYIKQADKTVLTLEGDNQLSSSESYSAIDENDIDAVIYSKDDLTINGSGSLTVTAPGGKGISSKDDLVLAGGKYNITTSDHGIDANDSIRIKDSSVTIASGKDGLHAENNDDASLGFVYIESATMDITSEGDGISGGAYVQIQAGTFQILSGGGYVNGQQKTSSNFGGFGGGMGPGGKRPGGMQPGGGRYATQTAATTTSTAEESTSIKGIKAGTDLLIAGGTFTIDAADDALHANTNTAIVNGSFALSTGDDGIHADETLAISGGTITVKESYEGLEGLNVQISGGDITLTCSDDGINAAGGTDSSGYGGIRGDRFGASSNGSIVISGGKIYMNASGDGIDANGSLLISGGHTTVCGPTMGDTAVLDYDTTAQITGGTFIGTGSSMMAQTFTTSTQGVIALSVGNQSAGTAIKVLDKNGNTLISDTPKLNFAIMIVSCPEMTKGDSYTVTVGNMTDSFEAS